MKSMLNHNQEGSTGFCLENPLIHMQMHLQEFKGQDLLNQMNKKITYR